MNGTNIIVLFLCARFCSLKFAVIHVTKFNVLHISVQKGWGVEMKLFGCAVREERSHNMPHRYTVTVPLCGVWLCSAFWLEILRTTSRAWRWPSIYQHICFLVNKTNRCTEFQFYWYVYYDSTCFGQPFCPSSGVLSLKSALVRFVQLWRTASRNRIRPTPGGKRSSQLHKMCQSRCTAKNSWWWAERLPEICRLVVPIKLDFSASVGFIHKESITMHGHTIVKYLLPFGDVCSFLLVVNYVSEVLAERFILMEYPELFPSSIITSDLPGMCRI